MFDEFSMVFQGALAEYAGFTEAEVRELCRRYGMDFEETKRWYDGYHFGNVDVYCPWDVLNYCDALLSDKDAQPENYMDQYQQQ